MADLDFRADGYSHQELWDMVHAGPGPRAGSSAEKFLQEAVDEVHESAEAVHRVIGRAADWTGKAADSATDLMGGLRDYAELARQGSRHYREQTLGQSGISGFARDTMPAPQPAPTRQPTGTPADLVPQSTDILRQEAAALGAEQRARDIMSRYAEDTSTRTAAFPRLPPAPAMQATHASQAVAPRSGTSEPVEVPSPAAAPAHEATPHVPRPVTVAPTPTAARTTTSSSPEGASLPATPDLAGPRTAQVTVQSGSVAHGVAALPSDAHEQARPPLDEPHGPDLGVDAERPAGTTRGTTTTTTTVEAPDRSGAMPYGATGRPQGKDDRDRKRRYGMTSDEYFDEGETDDRGALLDPEGGDRFVAPPVIGDGEPQR